MSSMDVLHLALSSFSENMNQTTRPEDSVVSIRVIGEFSAGKTRLIRELIKENVPSELLPVSSIEKQTYLPLEVTYGSVPKLMLIKRQSDYEAEK